MGDVALQRDDGFDVAAFVDDDLGLVQVEVDRPTPPPRVVQNLEEFAHLLEVNTVGPVRVTQALLPNLRAGQGKTIVGLSSGLGSIAANDSGGYYGYRESKAAIGMFMRNLAAELKGDGFICIAIDPGWVKTDMGGPGAQLTPEQSIGGMRKVLDSLKPSDTGKFYRHDGSTLPW